MLSRECCHKHIKVITTLYPKKGSKAFDTLRMRCELCGRYYHVDDVSFRATNSRSYKSKIDILKEKKALEITEVE